MDKGKESSTRLSKRKDSFKTGKPKGKKHVKRGSVSSEDELDDLFIWEKYLEKCHAKSVPKTAFKHITEAKSSGFARGMKVEARDQTNSDESYWVATVVMVSGPLLLLRFDGYDEDRSGDFWFNSNSDLLHPIGWCAKNNNILIPPVAIQHKRKNWAKFLVENLRDTVAAPDHLFFNKNDDVDNGHLKVGTVVEIQDDKDPLSYWTASIIEKHCLRLHLRFIGYDDEEYDVWEYYFSRRLHSLGWGKEMGMVLKPPQILEKSKKWSIYKNVVAECWKESQQLSKDVLIPKNNGLRPGMKLEAVNPEVPYTICVATVKEILSDMFFTVEIDCVHNSNSQIKFICHAKSKYLYPVGWCEMNSIKILPPRGYSTMSTFKWEKYLEITHSKAAPESVFDKDNIKYSTHKPAFKALQRVEVVDKDEPSCYWVGDVIDNTSCQKYHLQLIGSSNCSVDVYHCSDIVKPLGWACKNGLRLKPPKVMTYEWKGEISLLEGIFKAEISAASPMQKLDKQDDLPPPHGFEAGMQLEAVNPHDPSSICVASVIKCSSPHYFTVQIDTAMETSNNDQIRFWCFKGSKTIFPVGWCRRNNVQLTPPPGYPNTEFVWEIYMKVNQTKPAPESLFNLTPPSSDFQTGLKLEAADQTNPSTISVGTLTQVVGGTVWVRLDGYQTSPVEHIYDIESCNLFPVGWCSMHGHPLLAPQQKKKESETRRWAASLRKRVSDTSLADKLSKRLKQDSSQPTNSHKTNDKTRKSKPLSNLINSTMKETSSNQTPVDPVTSAAATPSSSTEDDRPNQQGSPDIVSVDTSSKPGNASKPTTTIDLTSEYSRDGDKELILFIKRSCSCGPYIDKKKLARRPDQIGPGQPNQVLKKVVEQVVLSAHSGAKVLDLLSSEKEKQSFLSILKTLSSKLHTCENLFSLNKVNVCSKCDKTESPTVNKCLLPTPSKPSSTTNSTTKPTTTSTPNQNKLTPINNNSASKAINTNLKQRLLHNNTKTPVKPAVQTSTVTKSESRSPAVRHDDDGDDDDDDDDDVVGKIPEGYISTWSTNDVVEFVTPRGCKNFASAFQEQEVDGKALMLLSLDDIHKVLGVTLGPAIKLHDDVKKLRARKK